MKDKLLAALTPYGQEHLLAFWDELDDRGRQSLAEQISAIDFAQVADLFAHRDQQSGVRQLAERAGSPPAVRLDGVGNRFTRDQARRRGLEALEAGEVGVLLVAGGQGTRLGFDHPKGMFPIGPLSEKTLFQIHVEKILARGRRHGARIPLYLMTSPATDAETREFFADNNRFGLAEEDLVIFCQGTMPAVDAQSGRVLLEAPGRIATSPDGHGGMLAALRLPSPPIRHLFYFQVDNPLVDIADPEFLGYHLLAGSELSTQVVAKHDPLERVGNVVEVDGRLHVIEYSDLPDDVAGRRNPDGSLAIWAGSIAVHAMDVGFLGRMAGRADALPFHTAYKKVAHIDAAGRPVQPERPNAVKFERFIFDLIPWADRAIVVEIDPAEGFAPLKNAPGAAKDTPEWVRGQMMAQHRRWLRAAGAEVADDVPVEISPLFALDAEQLRAKVTPGTRIAAAQWFGPETPC